MRNRNEMFLGNSRMRRTASTGNSTPLTPYKPEFSSWSPISGPKEPFLDNYKVGLKLLGSYLGIIKPPFGVILP